jgi:hypothetical protein
MIAGERAQIGEPLLLDFKGRGIHDIAWTGKQYLILAGDYRAAEDRGHRITQLYRWAGPGADPQWLADFPGLNPEALIPTRPLMMKVRYIPIDSATALPADRSG